MNYLKEVLAFHDWLETNQCDTMHQALWYHLMAINNKCAWSEWFTVANMTLQAKLGGIDKKTLDRKRNDLCNKGRIEYINQGKKAGKYRIISFGDNIRGINPLETSQSVPNLSPIESPLNKLNINETKQKDTIPFREIISALNEAVGTSYKSSTKKNQELIQARWNEGFRLPDFSTVIRKKVAQWKGTENEQYLRPLTLFGTKFESYLNQPEPKKNGQAPGEEEKDFGFQYDEV